MRSLRRLPKEEPQWWKPSQRRVVMEKVRKNNLEKKRVMYVVPLTVTQTIRVLRMWGPGDLEKVIQMEHCR